MKSKRGSDLVFRSACWASPIEDHSACYQGMIEVLAETEEKSQGPSPGKGKLEDQVSQAEIMVAGVISLENSPVKGTLDEAEILVRVEKKTERGKMMRGGPDDHVLVHGQEIDAGHAPDPETAGQDHGPGPGPERGIAAAAAMRGRDPWTSEKRLSRSLQL